MRIVVAYDISDNTARLRVAEWLQNQGFTRIQRSVFVGRGGIARARDVERFVARMIDVGRDVVHIFVVQDVEWERRVVVGSEGWRD